MASITTELRETIWQEIQQKAKMEIAFIRNLPE